ncbi:putative G-protein coupled receptor 160 isoform 1-T4 [Synchiropus picturatus]
MMAILEQVDDDKRTNYLNQYLFLLLVKTGLDVVILCLCHQRRCRSFLNMCRWSIILADITVVYFTLTLFPEKSPAPPCFLLAFASSVFGVLPLPVVCFAFLDYYLLDSGFWNTTSFCRSLRNSVLMMLTWTFAVSYAYFSVDGKPIEMTDQTNLRVFVCEVQESKSIFYFDLGTFVLIICATLPFWPRIPQWIREAQVISELRDNMKTQESSSLFVPGTENREENSAVNSQRPFLLTSLMLGFCSIWLPYIALSVSCLTFNIGVPTYIAVNLLWLECVNSRVGCLVFWLQSDTRGPYSQLPGDVCSWPIFWHLSHGRHFSEPRPPKQNTCLLI